MSEKSTPTAVWKTEPFREWEELNEVIYRNHKDAHSTIESVVTITIPTTPIIIKARSQIFSLFVSRVSL